MTGIVIYCTVCSMLSYKMLTAKLILQARQCWKSCNLFVFPLIISVLLSIFAARAKAQDLPSTPAPPNNFTLIDTANGVKLYRKDYPGGNPDFIQVIDLSSGGRLVLMHGEIKEQRPTKGAFGGLDPSMTSLPIQTYFSELQTESDYAFCTTNGQFFYMPDYPTRLAFPLKIDHSIISEGWGIDTYPDQKLLFQIWDDHADIVPLTKSNLINSNAPDIIGGLSEEANKRSKYSVGRTFIGLADRDNDRLNETVLIFNSLTATQSWAAETLRGFGAAEVMMLDGGGSTQLLCRSGWWIRSDRPIPQAIGVVSAPLPPVQYNYISFQNLPVLIEGERMPLEITIENSGIVSWTPQTTRFVIQADQLEFQQEQIPDSDYFPGETVTISQTMAINNHVGILRIPISMSIKIWREDISIKSNFDPGNHFA